MNDEQNKATTTPEAPDTLTDAQMEDVSGGAGTNTVNSALNAINAEACAKNNRARSSSRVRRLL